MLQHPFAETSLSGMRSYLTGGTLPSLTSAAAIAAEAYLSHEWGAWILRHHQLFCTVSPLVFFLLTCFSFFIPLSPAKELKNEALSLSLLHCQLGGCCSCSELEESMLLSNPFAPRVKDKEQDAWL